MSSSPAPDPDAPWRRDPLLAGKFHAQFPDDIQVLVHDGDPRRTHRAPELCWVRIAQVEAAPARRLAAAGVDARHDVYIGELLNQPHALTSVQRGERIKLISVPGLAHPLRVTEDYLRERAEWTITPCDKCGMSECLDPPSIMIKVRFPDLPGDAELMAFTSFCPQCGGVQQLQHG